MAEKDEERGAEVEGVDKGKPAKLEYETQDTTPQSRGPSLMRHGWQFVMWAPILLALAAAVLLPLIARGCAAMR